MKLTALLFVVLLLFTSGCVTSGNVKDAKVSFGVMPIFKVEKSVASASVSENGTVKEAEGKTHIQILNFEYESSAKQASVKIEKEKAK